MTTSERLARRYERLLLAYPRAYRAARGSELLGTLLENAGPDQARPPLREASALVFGGVRARIGMDRRRGYGTTVRMSVILAALAYVGMGLQGLFIWDDPAQRAHPLIAAIPLVGVVGLFAALYLRRRMLALAAAAAQVVMLYAITGSEFIYTENILRIVLPCAVVAALMRRSDPRPPITWPLLILVQIAAWVAVDRLPSLWHYAVGLWLPYLVLYGIALLGVFFDARVALSIVWLILIPQLLWYLEPPRAPWENTWTVLIIAGAVTGAIRARRDATL